jgi:hypothetical protein
MQGGSRRDEQVSSAVNLGFAGKPPQPNADGTRRIRSSHANSLQDMRR